jgi:hypothetical protein
VVVVGLAVVVGAAVVGGVDMVVVAAVVVVVGIVVALVVDGASVVDVLVLEIGLVPPSVLPRQGPLPPRCRRAWRKLLPRNRWHASRQ